MILNLLVILFIVISALMWASKARGYGMFSGFLAAACTVVAGGIGFALWEITAGLFLRLGSDNSTFLGGMMQDTAWGLGLLVPFLGSLLVLRLAVDTLVPKNLEFSETANFVGGAAFGAIAAALAAGIFVVAASHTRLPPRLLGYEPIEDQNGSLVYERGLWVPVDRLTIGLYEHLSRNALGTSTSLARLRPDAHVAGGMQRITFRGQTRTTLVPDQFRVVGRYRVAGELQSLLQDDFLPGRTQTVLTPDGAAAQAGSSMVGFVIRFDAGAKERGGNIIVTPGQVRLVVENAEGEVRAMHPVAAVAKPEPGGPFPLYRFRFDAREASISSGAGESEAVFAFEFLVPPGYSPMQLIVKNVRVPVGPDSGLAEREFARPLARDNAVRSQEIFTGFGAGAGSQPLDRSGSQRVAVRPTEGGAQPDIVVSQTLPDGMFFNRGNRRSLLVSGENRVQGGQATFDKAVFEERTIDRNLRVDSFESTQDTAIVQVTLARTGARSVFGRAVETAESVLPVVLVDSNGNRYEPVGFVYNDGQEVTIRFTPDRPIRALSEAPQLSRTAREQSLTLIYRPTRGVKLAAFALGNREVANFGPDGLDVR